MPEREILEAIAVFDDPDISDYLSWCSETDELEDLGYKTKDGCSCCSATPVPEEG